MKSLSKWFKDPVSPVVGLALLGYAVMCFARFGDLSNPMLAFDTLRQFGVVLMLGSFGLVVMGFRSIRQPHDGGPFVQMMLGFAGIVIGAIVLTEGAISDDWAQDNMPFYTGITLLIAAALGVSLIGTSTRWSAKDRAITARA